MIKLILESREKKKRKLARDILREDALRAAPSTRNREVVALRLLLNCIEGFDCPKNVRYFYVTREGYSKASKLLKNLLYDGDSRHDYWFCLRNFKELSLDKRYWFGIISDEQAVREISKITMGKKESIPYIVYSPAYHNEKGCWRILWKYPRDPRFYALNTGLDHRIEFSKLYFPGELIDYDQIISDEVKRVENEYCRDKWIIPEEEEMKISFHTPGALTYLREAKIAYVYTDETPKEMMKRVKKEARDQARREQDEKKKKETRKKRSKSRGRKKKRRRKETQKRKKRNGEKKIKKMNTQKENRLVLILKSQKSLLSE